MTHSEIAVYVVAIITIASQVIGFLYKKDDKNKDSAISQFKNDLKAKEEDFKKMNLDLKIEIFGKLGHIEKQLQMVHEFFIRQDERNKTINNKISEIDILKTNFEELKRRVTTNEEKLKQLTIPKSP